MTAIFDPEAFYDLQEDVAALREKLEIQQTQINMFEQHLPQPYRSEFRRLRMQQEIKDLDNGR